MSRMTRAFDKARAATIVIEGELVRPVSLAMPRIAGPAMVQPAMRALSIRAALEWAFGAERVSIEFDDFAAPAGRDTIHTLVQRGVLGCKVDGGGRSMAHDDAEVIASHVAALGPAFGGKGMAVQIASLARAGAAPDWMPDAKPRCVPVDMRMHKHGLFARTEVIGREDIVYRGRKVRFDVAVCPVTFRPSVDQIAAARRAYLDWLRALIELRYQISVTGLRTISLTPSLPSATPWHTRA